MAVERIADMTLDDLKALIAVEVDHRIQGILKPGDRRSVKEINESIRRNRWTPPAGAPSNHELLREARNA